MRWILCNMLGAFAWLVGLYYVKTSITPNVDLWSGGDYRVWAAMGFCLVGLAVLVWTNMRNAA